MRKFSCFGLSCLAATALCVLSPLAAWSLGISPALYAGVRGEIIAQEFSIRLVNDSATSMEAPEGVVYCGGGQIKRQIEYVILKPPPDQWDAKVTVNGKSIKAMTSYSYFGSSAAPAGFLVALLGEDRSEFLVFQDGDKDWLEFGDYTYRKCN